MDSSNRVWSWRSFKSKDGKLGLVVEVDDLFGIGDEYFFQMEQLRNRFDFGKFVVTERLSPVKLATGRATNAKDAATPEEKEMVRAAVGSLTWAAKEG